VDLGLGSGVGSGPGLGLGCGQGVVLRVRLRGEGAAATAARTAAARTALTAVAEAGVVDRFLRHGAASQELGELCLALRGARGMGAHDVERCQRHRREPAGGRKRRN
jgi:hypothetical protein